MHHTKRQYHGIITLLILCAFVLGAFGPLQNFARADVAIEGQTLTDSGIRKLATQLNGFATVTNTDIQSAFATGTLTSNNTNVSNNDTVTIGNKTYTFKTALTPTEGEVLIGGSADASLLNLIRAINHTGTPNTDYKCAAAHTQVTAASAVTAHAFAITSILAGATGEYATTETATTLSFGAAKLTGGSSVKLDPTKATVFKTTLTGNRAVDIVGHKAGQVITFIVAQDGTGSRLITWDSDIKWAAGTAPTLTTTASTTDVLEFIDDGTYYIGRALVQNVP